MLVVRDARSINQNRGQGPIPDSMGPRASLGDLHAALSHSNLLQLVLIRDLGPSKGVVP